MTVITAEYLPQEKDLSNRLHGGEISATERELTEGRTGLPQNGESVLLQSSVQGEDTVVENPDTDIIRECCNGNADAFSLIVERYQDLIHKQMRWYARDALTCEELVHDVFVQAYMSLPTFRAKAPFEHWLRKIASRVGYRHIKKQSKAANMLPIEEWDATCAPPKDGEIDAQEANDLLCNLLGKLRAEERMVLTLTYFEELGTKEIAERMGWNRAMVKMRVYRAKKKLKGIVEDEGLAEKYEI